MTFAIRAMPAPDIADIALPPLTCVGGCTVKRVLLLVEK